MTCGVSYLVVTKVWPCELPSEGLGAMARLCTAQGLPLHTAGVQGVLGALPGLGLGALPRLVLGVLASPRLCLAPASLVLCLAPASLVLSLAPCDQFAPR